MRYVGEPVAIVVAKDRYTAEDAIEKIKVSYKQLPSIVDIEKTVQEDAPDLT
ncbi:hypothetical protein RCO48_31105 [Peribacillus frigoritolerans]|nr:hypothetical protein [Peribacillus frigoritolerans]